MLTDTSFHHFADLNLIGDPCAVKEKTQGFDLKLLNEMDAFFINIVRWLARYKRSKHDNGKCGM